MATTKENLKLSTKAREMLTALKRRDLDYTHVDLATYHELRDAGLALVHFSTRGNFVFATDAGRAALTERAGK